MVSRVRPTQADIAKRAGVSQAMVSYVLNKNSNIKIPEETRQRVLEAMQALGYVPNVLARGLRMGQTKTIGLVVPDNSNPFFAEISRIIEGVGFEQGYSVILCNSDYNSDKEKAYVDVLLTKQVDGIIFISSGEGEETSQKLWGSQTPFVVVNRDISDMNEAVRIDYKMGGYLATKHLLGLGHQRIACITGPVRSPSNAQRLEGYVQALEEAKIAIDDSFIVAGDFRIQGGELAMRQLLKLHQPPTAVFACNDLMAMGVIQAVHNHGLKVPEDISLVGFDDIPLAQAIYPTLTTIAQPMVEIANVAMDMLVKQIHGKVTNSRDQIVLQPKLIARDSTKVVKPL